MKTLFENTRFLNEAELDPKIEESCKKLMKEFFTVYKKHCKDGTPKLVDSPDNNNPKPKLAINLHIIVTGCKNNDVKGSSACIAFKEAAEEFGFEKVTYGSASNSKKYPSISLECYTDTEENNMEVIYCTVN